MKTILVNKNNYITKTEVNLLLNRIKSIQKLRWRPSQMMQPERPSHQYMKCIMVDMPLSYYGGLLNIFCVAS